MSFTRRENDTLRERFAIPYDHAQVVDSDLTVKLFDVPRAARVVRAWYNNPTGLAAHATNYFNIKVLAGANVAANWSTESGQEGTLTGDEPVELTLGTGPNRALAAGDELALFLDENDAGTATLPAGRIVVELEYL